MEEQTECAPISSQTPVRGKGALHAVSLPPFEQLGDGCEFSCEFFAVATLGGPLQPAERPDASTVTCPWLGQDHIGSSVPACGPPACSRYNESSGTVVPKATVA